MDPRALDCERRIAGQCIGVELAEPELDRRRAAAAIRRQGDLREDPRRAIEIADLERVLERRLRIVMPLEPIRSASAQLLRQLGLRLEELSPQEITEEMVIAEPEAVLVQRDEEEIRVPERLELVERVARLERRVAECTAHLLEHGRAAQEGQPLGREPRHVLGVEVVRDVADVALGSLRTAA